MLLNVDEHKSSLNAHVSKKDSAIEISIARKLYCSSDI